MRSRKQVEAFVTESKTGLTHYDFDINPTSVQSGRGKGIQASNDNRCPCCDSPSWCFILDDGNAVICGRTDVAPLSWERTGTAKDQRPIYALVGTSGGYQRYKGILPSPSSIILKTHPLADFPQWVEIGSDYGGVKELQMDFLYPDAETGEPLGKVVRKQWSDRRRAYNNGKDTKQLRPHHWAEPYHPDQGSLGWWSDRGKGSKPWPLYREAEAGGAITSIECNILFNGTGEQAVESFRRLGLFSIGAAGGEGTGDAQIIDFLKRNTPQVFVIAADEDEAGHKAAAKLQQGCNKAKLPTLTINLKNIWSLLPPKGDITNILNESGMSESEIVKRLEAEIRRAIAKSLEHDRKLNDPDERLKLELQALLAESDPIKRMRKRAEIASHHRLSKAEISQALSELEQLLATPEVQWHSLDAFLDLKSEGLRWVVPGLLPVGETVLLAGAPKSGKTLMALDVAFSVATGESAFLRESVKKGRVLIISVDESASSTKAKLIKRGFRRSDAANVQVMSRFDMGQLKVLEERLDVFRPTLVLVDSLKRISHRKEISENSAEFANDIYALKELLTRYDAAGLLIHHTSKNPDALGVGKIRGSSAIAGAVWGTWLLEAIPKTDPHNKKKLLIDPSDPKRILSVHARDAEGQQLRVELDLENHSWTNHGNVGDSEEAETERKTLQTRILDVLARNTHKPGLSGREIIELMEMAESGRGSVYTTLNRMVSKRLITCNPAPEDRRYNLYSLPKLPPNDEGGDNGDSGPSGGNPDLSPTTANSDPSPPPLPCVSNVNYDALPHTQQEFPVVNKLLNKYLTDSQHQSELTTSVNYSKVDTASIPEIVNNVATVTGGEGVTSSLDKLVMAHSNEPHQPLIVVGDVVTISNPGSKYHDSLATVVRLKVDLLYGQELQKADVSVPGEKRYVEVQVSWLRRVEETSINEQQGGRDLWVNQSEESS